MVPSMVAAMLIPMAVCALDLIGYSLGGSGALRLGAALGLGIFLFIQAYGWRYRRFLRQAFPKDEVSDENDLGRTRQALRSL